MVSALTRRPFHLENIYKPLISANTLPRNLLTLKELMLRSYTFVCLNTEK